MKGKKFLAMLCGCLLVVAMLAGCGGKDDADSKKTDSADNGAVSGDVSDPAGYYQWTYDVEGLGTWVNYIHLYEESSIGSVYYMGVASNQMTQAGTYEIVNEKCDYEVAFERAAEGEEQKMEKGSADYTIVFTSFDGAEMGRCAYDGTYIYNDTENVCATGCEKVRMTKDPDGLDGKYGQADSGYQGEVGIAYLTAKNPEDETCTVTMNHNGTYADLIGEYEVDGTWELSADKKTYTLTPDDASDTGATVVVSDAGDSATYTPDGGEAVELAIDTKKAASISLKGGAHSDTMGLDIDVEMACYADKTCELIISMGPAAVPLDQGTYSVEEDGSIKFTMDTLGELTANSGDTGVTLDINADASAYGLGTLETTLEQQ